MRTTLKALANIAAAGGLTLWILTWIAWVPGMAAISNYAIETHAWGELRAADSWLRLSLGATVGPESDEMMLTWCCLAVSFIMAIAIVWGANRLFRRITRPRHNAGTSRAASAVS